MNHGVAPAHRAFDRTTVAQVPHGEVEREPRNPPGRGGGMHKGTERKHARERQHLAQAPPDEAGRAGDQHASRQWRAHGESGPASESSGGAGFALAGVTALLRRSSVASHQGSGSGFATA